VITTLISDVASAYFNLLEVDMELAIAKNTLAAREESLRVIKVQQQGGAATLLDVRQAEQLVYGAAELLLNAERLIEQTENQISLLLGRNPGPVIRSRRRHYRRARCRDANENPRYRAAIVTALRPYR
jgi:multidrug efflux system outer membrane protein